MIPNQTREKSKDILRWLLLGFTGVAVAYGFLVEIDPRLVYVGVVVAMGGAIIWAYMEGHLQPLIDAIRSDDDGDESSEPTQEYSPWLSTEEVYSFGSDDGTDKSSIEKLKEYW